MTASTSHSSVQEILPTYVNGTASAAERELVTQHLDACAECRDELILLQQLEAAVSDEAADVPPFRSQFSKTMAAIDEWESAQRSGVFTRLVTFLTAPWHAQGRLVQATLAVQFAAIVLLAAVLIVRQPGMPYSTLSGPDVVANGPRLTVIFQPGAPEESVRRAVLDVNGAIVSGPSAAGVYLVQLPGSTNDAMAIDRAITSLRSRTTVVQFAEQQP